MNEQEIAVKLTEIDQRSRSNSHRLEEVEKKLEDNEQLLTNVALIAQKQNTLESDVQEIKSDVKSLTQKPAQRWESVVEKIILALVAAGVTFLLTQIGIPS